MIRALLLIAGCLALPACARTPGSQRPTRPPPGAGGTDELVVDDFEDGNLESRLGLAWMVIADDIGGGASTGRVEFATAGERRVLRLTGERRTAEGSPIGFVGAWTAVGGGGLPRDLSEYQGVRVRALASAGGGFQVSLRRAGSTSNFSAPVELGPEWTEIDVAFASLQPLGPTGGNAPRWSAADVTWVGITSVGTDTSPVGVDVDRLSFYGGPKAEDARASAIASGSAGSAVATVQLADARQLVGLRWHELARESAGDARSPRLPDAIALAWTTGRDGRIWFRVSLADAPPERWMGVNVALDTDGDPANGLAWWGSNSGFHFDELVTAYLTEAESYWLGSVGVSSAADVAGQVMDARTSDVVAAIDRENRAYLVGVPRDALPERGTVRLIATVGSSMINNDDLPGAGAIELELPASSAR